MPLKSKWNTPIPEVSLPTYIFGSPRGPLSTTPLLMDAQSPAEHYLSAHTYRLWCKRFAAGLRAAGLQPGERVLLFSGNTIFFPVVLVGTIMAGGIFTGANPSFVPRELAYQLEDSGARFMIAAQSSWNVATEAARLAGLDDSRVFVFDDGRATHEGKGRGIGNARHWTALVADETAGEKFVWEELSLARLKYTTTALNYSSGTTGVPKGVEITHRNYVSNAVQMIFQSKLDSQYEEKTARAKLLCFLPLYHAMAQTIFGITALKQRIPVYVMAKFDFVQSLEYIQKYRITNLILVPPVVVALAKHPITKKYDLSSVETVGCGAAPLGREVCVELEKLWPDGKVNVKQGWGMTELTCSAIGWHPEDYSDSFSIGQLHANTEAVIVNDNGKEVAQGEPGEIWVRAPNVMKGYWNKPVETAATLSKSGWLKTGDVAYVNEKGFFFVVDRKKELIKVKGNQVAPAELEALLLNHEDVSDVAVIGVKIEHDESPRAYIVKREGSSSTPNDILKWMNAQVVAYKRLTGGVRLVKAIPKNPSGKILRKALRDQAEAEIENSKKDSSRSRL